MATQVLWQRVMAAGSSSNERAEVANEIDEFVKTKGIHFLEDLDLFGRLRDSLKSASSSDVLLSSLLLLPSLPAAAPRLLEPHLVALLPLLLERLGDKTAAVKAAAEAAAEAIITNICPHAIRQVLPILFDGARHRKNWKVQQASLKLLEQLVAVGPRQVAASLPLIVPLLSELMVDGKEQVMKAAKSAMVTCSSTIGNRDIEHAIPSLVDSILRADKIADVIQQLSGITFVQPVLAPALAIMAPVFVRGMKERAMLVKRKTVVVIDNVLRLVEQPQETGPFLPQLLPGVERVSVEVADPECRQTAGRVHKTLLGMKEEVEARDKAEEARHVDATMMMSLLKQSSTSGALEGWEKQPLLSETLHYVIQMACSLYAQKCFEEEEWQRCVAPYLQPFLQSKGEESETVAKSFLSQVLASCQDKEEQEEEDDEGEDLCNCEFSLGYGGKILLNATRLWLKRGRRYGLCGHNGCGKSTLMKAIASGKLDGFPPQDVLRTVYVEHDLDSSLVEQSPVQYLLAEPLLKDKTDEASVRSALETTGFSAAMKDQMISSLSGGWKMKLALARAMLIGADILLLDEPTNHLDVANIAWLENYLTGLKTLSCLIVSHDSGFLDAVCTDIIHYEKRKLKHYRGNLSAFVKVKPEARVYYDLAAASFKFTFPQPGLLDGIKRKESPILKLSNVGFRYPAAERNALEAVNVQCCLGSRVGVVGVNGAGKSTLIKLLTGETKPTSGTIWRHPNLGMAYVAQHAFHHVEQHLEKSPNEYIQWRFARGEDREELNKVHRKITREEEKGMQELIMHNGERKQVEQLLGRRKSKKSYEYEVKWVGLKPVFNSWLSRELLEDLGFEKLVHDVDAKEVARLGVFGRPLTIAGVQEHFDNFGLDAEFATYGQIGNLSGGQKVKVVLAAAMWSNPHMIVLDEPTNFLDRDSLGALVAAIHEYSGGVVVISHNRDFLASLTNETWSVVNGRVEAPGNPAWEKAQKSQAAGGKKK